MTRREFLSGAPLAMIPTAMVGKPKVEIEAFSAGDVPGSYIPKLNKLIEVVGTLKKKVIS